VIDFKPVAGLQGRRRSPPLSRPPSGPIGSKAVYRQTRDRMALALEARDGREQGLRWPLSVAALPPGGAGGRAGTSEAFCAGLTRAHRVALTLQCLRPRLVRAASRLALVHPEGRWLPGQSNRGAGCNALP